MPWSAPRRQTAAAAARRREYDSAEYRRTRERLGQLVADGQAWCWRCGRWLAPGMAWHTGHDDHDRRIIRGTECAGCNLKAAASKGAQIANAQRQTTRLRW